MSALLNQQEVDQAEMTESQTRWWVVAFFVCIIAAVYDTQSGQIEFINDSAIGFDPSLAGDQMNHL